MIVLVVAVQLLAQGALMIGVKSDEAGQCVANQRNFKGKMLSSLTLDAPNHRILLGCHSNPSIKRSEN